MRGSVSSAVLFMVLAAAAMPPAASSAAAGQGCANEALRVEQGSASLPDCRAYEMVSPVDKNGGDVTADGDTNRASVDGNAVAYGARTGFGDTTGSGYATLVQYVAVRGPGGWQTHAITPTPAADAAQVAVGATRVEVFSEDMHKALVEAYALPQAPTVGVKNEVNLYVEDTAPGGLLETITAPAGIEEVRPTALVASARGASQDLGVVTFETTANLVTGASGEARKLYVFEHGALHLAGILPGEAIPVGGSSVAFAMPGFESLEQEDTVSRDGSRILFVSPADGSAPPQLYMRKNGSTTAWVSESEASTPNPEPQNVVFQAASPDGKSVVFTSTDRLLDADPGGEGYGIYLYRDSANPSAEPNLTFIARSTGSDSSYPGPESAIVKGLGEDATRIYFESESMLYLWDAGTIHKVAPAPDALEGGETQAFDSRVSADGREIAFVSSRSLTARDTAGHSEMYVWDEADAQLRCASCPGGGASASASVELEPAGTTEAGFTVVLPISRRFLTSDGSHLFFSTAQALVPQDVNGLPDVYEYDIRSGEARLISPGVGNSGSWFAEASPSGGDVFMVTREALSGWDKDDLVDLYDARTGGGLAEPPPPPAGCSEDECQGIPSAVPSFSASTELGGLSEMVAAPPAARAAPQSSGARKLARELAACKKKPKRKQARCRANTRKRYRKSKQGRHATRRAGR